MAPLMLLFMALCLQMSLADNCSSARSCSECMAADTQEKACYWCKSLVTNEQRSGCLRFKTDEIANLLCPAQWVHIRDMCPAIEGDDIDDRVHRILSKLESGVGGGEDTVLGGGGGGGLQENMDAVGLK